ncbi:MAG: hypothetical protein A3D24_02295 [Candidatus Blackburnbacteria bacterium RIFCSPHIGHO2_02_FULL_39_13]|uniref:Addiction module toxin RelE n=1 Tax=Candidatus Blackburnbacteria bacterium RIFCSPLOWO2_01_FULL_40_20 TaxID=1797519 RepID=A0A1G1VB94_9BACT|nr:MAG: hypothetical protein A2694_02885 [Candidatus Blackburnbacteria bacterium RIFCSPHIGHO2_01_FULL_40_17]OGY09513.1 MAG: hypothetical protein A3D24_02295 [Candidatus Blackburnbacteria bacterium RIFCSPHIGHO2_02_FULL_39_13]OGY12527.1 MAG: hypothetical protein A3A77_00965 [Candidatus Blackburnbacteria bacterium RIFCSPLOWO2_01_FULL_40_20]OGY15134.1 MAG: hypothetical protein A3I52_00080 [Candidatus Blackburnbacteria bacterium RIFCSPLOWO2_02_FULL_40_10]HBL51671.1 hypothetical protein [Candidatus B
MTIRYSSDFLRQLKKLNVRVRKSFKEKITTFIKNPFSPELDNHSLKREYQGYRSIDITNDYRAIYQEKVEGDELVAYFISIGTHKELYEKSTS